MKKYKRNVQENLLHTIANSPATLITGARQTGKTTLIQKIGLTEGFHYVSFDDLFAQGAAEADPIGFIENLSKPVILDEVQSAPKIFLPMKKDIDQHREPGRYILTGSANPLIIPKLGDSLAGRMQIIHLWPLSQGELRGVKEEFIDNIFAKNSMEFAFTKASKNSLIELAIKGGYPALQHIEGERIIYGWLNSYLTSLIQKDITDLAKIENLHSIPNILQALATRAGSILNERDISRSVGIPLTTVRRYLQLLQHLFLIFPLPGWYRNLTKRIIKSPKIYFVDTAILLHLLGFNYERLVNNPIMLGYLIENFIIVEIMKQLTWCQSIVKPYHYRSHDGSIEVDLVLESTAGKVVGIEVKSSETISHDDFKGLKQLQQDCGKEFHQGILLYCGKSHYSFGNNLQAIPITALWNN